MDSVTVNGVAATTERVQVPAETKYKLRVTPATPVSGTFTTVVNYSGTPSRAHRRRRLKEGWNAHL